MRHLVVMMQVVQSLLEVLKKMMKPPWKKRRYAVLLTL